MFSNIGGKIMAAAKVLCWLGIIASIIIGIVFFWAASEAYNDGTLFAVFGVLVIVLGSIMSWVGSFFLYGFGQLVENSDSLVYLTRRLDKEDNKEDIYKVFRDNKEHVAKGPTWTCPVCMKKNEQDIIICQSCGSPRP